MRTDLFAAAPPPGGTLDRLSVQAVSSNPADRLEVDTTLGVHRYRANFQTLGPRNIDVRISYPGVAAAQSMRLEVEVINTAPTLKFVSLPFNAGGVGDTLPLSVLITDPNEPDPSSLCRNVRWRVDEPDKLLDLDGVTGCSQRVRFGASGTRQVHASTVDREGLAGSVSAGLNVAVMPENPYPRITSSALATASVQTGQDTCRRSIVVNAGATLDLTSLPANDACDGQPNEARYYASVAIENPSGEALRVDWELWVDEPTRALQRVQDGTTRLPVIGAAYGTGGEHDCGIVVRVLAPDGLRSKVQPVWTGRCKLRAVAPN